MRPVLWLLLAAFLLIVGVWPSAAAPVGLVFDGAGVIAARIPAVVLVGLTAVFYLRHRRAPARRAA